jgi:hypothetical protein
MFGLGAVFLRETDVLADALLHHVGGDAEVYRAGAPAERGPQQVPHHVGHLFCAHEHHAGLGGRAVEVDDVDAERGAFLRGALAERGGGHLGGEEQHGNRVPVRAGDACEGIGGAGARGRAADAEPVAHAGVAVRHEGGAFLVFGQDGTDLAAVEDRFVERHQRAARYAENAVYSFALQVAEEEPDRGMSSCGLGVPMRLHRARPLFPSSRIRLRRAG